MLSYSAEELDIFECDDCECNFAILNFDREEQAFVTCPKCGDCCEIEFDQCYNTDMGCLGQA